MLAQAVESLIVRTLEKRMPGETVLLDLRDLGNIDTNLTVRDAEGLEGLTTLLYFLEQLVACSVVEDDTAIFLVDTSLNAGGFHADLAVVLADVGYFSVACKVGYHRARLYRDAELKHFFNES